MRLSDGQIRPAFNGVAEIEIADRPDPDRPDRGKTPPMVRGARRHDGVKVLFGDRSPEFIAAERFRDDCALAAGIRESFEVTVHTGFNPERYGFSQAQLDALRRAEDAWQAIGLVATGVVGWVVLGSGSVHTYTQRYAVSNRIARRWLENALARLVAYYEAVDGGRK